MFTSASTALVPDFNLTYRLGGLAWFADLSALVAEFGG
jgi:hypothetical protein